MTDAQTPAAVAALADLVGERGRLTIAFEAATRSTGGWAGARWHPLVRELERAMGLAAALEAGRGDGPVPAPGPGEPQPCQRCGGRTPSQLNGVHWHRTCWLTAGCPTTSADGGTVEGDDTAATEIKRQRPSEGAASAAVPPRPAPRRQRPADRRRGTEADRTRFVDRVDQDEELAAFARALRSVDRRADATDAECAAALAAWHRCLRLRVRGEDRPIHFVTRPGYTGVTLYELLNKAHGAMVTPEALTHPLAKEITAPVSPTVRTLGWLNPDATVTAGMALTELDVTAQYLAASRSVLCGDVDPDVHGSVSADELGTLVGWPGWLQLASAPDLSTLAPHARHALSDVAEGWWLPCPLAKYARQRGVALDVARAVVWPQGRHGNRLDAWGGVVADARRQLIAGTKAGQNTQAHEDALAVVKLTYAGFLGGMLRSEEHNDTGTLRPDWADMVVSQAGANELRALDKLADPSVIVGGLRDAVWLATEPGTAPVRPSELDYADKAGKWENRPGKWHVNRWGTVTEKLARAHARGRIGNVHDEVIAADELRKAEEEDA